MNATDASDIVRKKLLLALEQQKESFRAKGEVKYRARISRLDRAIGLLIGHQDKWIEALNADFGHRSPHQSLLTDIVGALTPLKFARANLAKWMRPQTRSLDFALSLFGAKGHIEHTPLGAVGLISPWNFPVQLTFGPLAGILAAGNRVMIKPSEYTPATSELMRDLISTVFDPTEIAVIPGDHVVGSIFSSLPFDHLMFTGSSATARHVMRAAAENLVPVTLELGGKSPVVIDRGAPLGLSAKRIMLGKLLNGGQICLAPDYLWIPYGQTDKFIEAAHIAVKQMFPTLLANPDYTSIINEQHYYRLHNYLQDAHDKGAEVITLNPADEDFSNQPHYKMVPTLILNAKDNMEVMQQEIFGPILPIKEYDQIDDVIEYINAHDKPLALYYFGDNATERRTLINNTSSGTVAINDVVTHFTQENLPFGGIGSSGMGVYKGYEGFLNFSHKRSVFKQARLDVAKIGNVSPPWGIKTATMLKRMIKP